MTTQLSKSAAQFHDFHTRTGSSSTKGFQNGRVDVMPASAKDDDLNALPIIEQYRIAKNNYEAICKEFQQVVEDNTRRKGGPSKARQAELQPILQAAKSRYCYFRDALNLARDEAEGALFKQICRSRLRKDLFREIIEEVEATREFVKTREFYDAALAGGER